ncbi:MAG: hypothetical protein ACKVQC_04430 [Elusimicrobiota bacterium]
MDSINLLRKCIPHEEFDYQTVVAILGNYQHPRDKITSLLRKKEIIRIKKGIYIFGENNARESFSREVLGNMLYGPSYISLDYALHYHGLIPERTEAITSVTTGRKRRFSTPVGLFFYQTIPLKAYPWGIKRIELSDNRSFFIASAEKAIADKIYTDRGTAIRSQIEIKQYILKHLRIDGHKLKELNTSLLLNIAKQYRSQKIFLLSKWIEHFNKGSEKHE